MADDVRWDPTSGTWVPSYGASLSAADIAARQAGQNQPSLGQIAQMLQKKKQRPGQPGQGGASGQASALRASPSPGPSASPSPAASPGPRAISSR